MLAIGLTGGIACGKSTVAAYFAELGVPVIDADDIARTILHRDMPAYTAIVAHFGKTILHPDGTINRQQLRQQIFHDATERCWLNQLTHPLVRQAMQQQKSRCTAPYCLLMIPLLVENLPYPMVDRILTVDCPADLQKQRLLQREAIDANLAEQMISAQINRQQRLAKSDDVIDNSTNDAALRQQVNTLHQHYQTLAKTNDD